MTTPALNVEDYTKAAATWSPAVRQIQYRGYLKMRMAPTVWNDLPIEDRERIEANAAVLKEMVDSDSAAGFV